MKSKLLARLIISLSFVTLALGIWGVREQQADATWSSCLYQAIQLFSLNYSGDSNGVPTSLDIARFLAPLVAGIIIASFFAFFKNVKDWFNDVVFLRRFRTHHVICGLGEKGLAIAKDLLGHGKKILIIEKNPDLPSLSEIQNLGATIVIGDACEKHVLEKARVHLAECMICAAGEDDTNLGMALVAARILSRTSRKNSPLSILVHVSDIAYRDVLQRNHTLELKTQPQHQIRVVNIHHNIARLIFKLYPLEVDNEENLRFRPHLIIPQLDGLALALILQAARICHYPDLQKATIHLVSKNAEAERSRILALYPNFECCSALKAVTLDESTDFEQAAADIVFKCADEEFATILLTAIPDYKALATGLMIRERLRQKFAIDVRPILPSDQSSTDMSMMRDRLQQKIGKFRVLISSGENSAVSDILMENQGENSDCDLGRWISLIPGFEQACGHEVLLRESLDEVAKNIYKTWYVEVRPHQEKLISEGRLSEVKSTFKLWSEYTEEQKDANRIPADHLQIKIRAAGLSSSDPELLAKWKLISAETLEILSKMEHARWSAEKWLSGWNLGQRNDALRIHDNLIPYENLSDDTKKYDRDQVRKVAEYFVSKSHRKFP
jgi:voltage-gated potassium channel Kch